VPSLEAWPLELKMFVVDSLMEPIAKIYRRRFSSLIGIFLCLQGCSPTQESFLTIQTCVVNQQGVALLKSTMHAVAKAENLEFIDNSLQQGSELKMMGAEERLKRDAALAIDVHIDGAGGIGVTASNLGLPSYQVAVGFTNGSDAAKAHLLARRLVQALSKQWQVETIPQGSGVSPMKTCGG
jgi:hypothetical protein